MLPQAAGRILAKGVRLRRASHLRVSFASTSDDRGGGLGDRVAASLPSGDRQRPRASLPFAKRLLPRLCYGGAKPEEGVANMLQSELDGKRAWWWPRRNALGMRRASS